MLNHMTPEMLIPLLQREHPDWNTDMLNRQAMQYIFDIHELLEPALYAHIMTNDRQDFQFGKFSILQIQMIQPGKSYFGALLLMNEYIKDRELGESLILRHW